MKCAGVPSGLVLALFALGGCGSTPRGVATPIGGAAGSRADAGGGLAGNADAGAGGAAGAVACTITAQSSLSTAIPTVGIVTWTTDLPGLSGAAIQFAPADGSGTTMVAPVDLTQPSYQTLLLGMKASRAYAFQILADAGSATCASGSYLLTTGPA
ncbi:MAG TPA: hypothetical protein VI456_13780, partial [Polyangia bacterium]